MNEERDFVVFTDDDGNDFELDVIDYFDYNDKEYAVLVDTNDECELQKAKSATAKPTSTSCRLLLMKQRTPKNSFPPPKRIWTH